MTNYDAVLLNVKNGDYCKVRVGGAKSTIYENVLIRINDSWKLQIHLDNDDTNVAFISRDAYGEF